MLDSIAAESALPVVASCCTSEQAWADAASATVLVGEVL